MTTLCEFIVVVVIVIVVCLCSFINLISIETSRVCKISNLVYETGICETVICSLRKKFCAVFTYIFRVITDR